MSFSAISIMTSSPILYCLILSDKNNNNRTLINQLVVSVMCTGLAWCLIVQTTVLSLYTFQPINNSFVCKIIQLLPAITSFHCLLLHDAIIVVKYIFIFQLKNPTALQDDFWRIFTNIWIISFCLITQIIFLLLPGKDSLGYYFCMGKIEVELIEELQKTNYTFTIAGNLSVVLHVAFWIWKKTIKYHNTNMYSLYKEYKVQFTNSLNKETLFHYVTHTIAALSLVAVLIYFPQMFLQMNPIEADTYPNYILIYCQDLIVGNCGIMFVVGILLATKPNLQRELLQEFKELF